jgi:hypothetical protein
MVLTDIAGGVFCHADVVLAGSRRRNAIARIGGLKAPPYARFASRNDIAFGQISASFVLSVPSALCGPMKAWPVPGCTVSVTFLPIARNLASSAAAYPDGPSRLSWPGLIYVRVRPTWIRYSNYSVDLPEIVEFSVQQLV